jgi:hypothetical protein
VANIPPTKTNKQTTNKQSNKARKGGETLKLARRRAKADEQMRWEHLAAVSVAAELQVDLAQPAVHTAHTHDPRTMLASLARAGTYSSA